MDLAHNIDGEYIRRWLVLGPFFPDRLDTDFLADIGGETDVNPRVGDAVNIPEGRTLTWKQHRSESDYINLQDVMRQLLFTIELKFQGELDNSRKLSDELRQAFMNGSLPLSDSARIAIDDRGSR